MSDKFLNKYRIPSARAPWWDYNANGIYFITICTSGHECCLGKIVDGEMIYSKMGEIAKDEWLHSFKIRCELFCEIYVIMPNHIHAIVRISNDTARRDARRASLEKNNELANENEILLHKDSGLNVDCDNEMMHEDARRDILNEDARRASLQGVAKRLPKSISSFVAGYKSAVTKQIGVSLQIPKLSIWQTRFHDHIIRTDEEYQNISYYIQNNPINWEKDKFYR